MTKREAMNFGVTQPSVVEWSAPPVTEAAPDEDGKTPALGGDIVREEMVPGLCEGGLEKVFLVFLFGEVAFRG